MPLTYRVRPSRAGSLLGGIVGLGMLFFGTSYLGIGDSGFVLLWDVVLIGIILANFYNAFSDRGVATNTVEITGQDHPVPPIPDTAARLRQLADLRCEGLITPAEHDQRRAELVRHL